MGKHCISAPSFRCWSFPHFELAHPETCNSIMCTHPPKPGSRRPFGSLCFVLEPSSPSKDSICPRKLGSALLSIRLQTPSRRLRYPCKTRRTSFAPYGPAGITWGWEHGDGARTDDLPEVHDAWHDNASSSLHREFLQALIQLSSSSVTAPGPGLSPPPFASFSNCPSHHQLSSRCCLPMADGERACR